jgi:ABC-2 type transport system ATP-binding protein
MYQGTNVWAAPVQHQSHYLAASIRGVSKVFAGQQALNGIDLDIKSSQVLAILGANGAGKTTLINILLGRLEADSGDIRVLSNMPGSLPVKQQTGAMLQVSALPDTLKVKEHIQLFQSYYPNPMPYHQVIEYAGLESLQNRYSKKLSGGEKQRLLFALSICGNPKLLFLDEPSYPRFKATRHCNYFDYSLPRRSRQPSGRNSCA